MSGGVGVPTEAAKPGLPDAVLSTWPPAAGSGHVGKESKNGRRTPDEPQGKQLSQESGKKRGSWGPSHTTLLHWASCRDGAQAGEVVTGS